MLASVGKLSEERKELTPEDDDGRDDEEHGEDGEAAAVDERRQKHPVTDRRLTVPRPTTAVNAHLLLQPCIYRVPQKNYPRLKMFGNISPTTENF